MRPSAIPSPHKQSTGERLSVEQLAHELNSLLDGARRCLRLALERDGADALEHLELAGDALDRMAALLQRTMDAPATGMQVLASDVPLAEALPRLLTLFRPWAEELSVDLALVLDPAAGRFRTGLLEAVIGNGLRNAIEAAARSPRGDRRVEVVLSRGGGELELCISDTGPGPPEAEPAPRPGRPGAGLGLPLCRQIVARLGGELELLSVPYGAGAVLRVRVPAGEAGGAEP